MTLDTCDFQLGQPKGDRASRSFAKIDSCALSGIDAFPVEIEVDVEKSGEPQIMVVGLPDTAVKESQYRVSTAIHNSDCKGVGGRITVNLAPADIRKEGPLFDLPIALGMLIANGDLEIRDWSLDDIAVVGELALSGEVRRVRGILPLAIAMRDAGKSHFFVPKENAAEAAVVDGVEIIPIGSLREAVEILRGTLPAHPYTSRDAGSVGRYSGDELDFIDVKGQEGAKRAIQIAVAGGHNVIMIGPPGTGKTMLAKRISSILPPMTLQEALEATKVHSIAGLLPAEVPLLRVRPFRAPHHTVSDAGLLGGGTNPSPGEVSLAHNGVLFLDELPEFHRNVLEVLRQPLEEGVVTIARVAATVTYPCRFILVAAMNPCPCGYFGDPKRECRCTRTQIQNYRNKVSGPLLDRIDIHIEVPATRFIDLQSMKPGMSSADMRQSVLEARETQQARFRDLTKVHCNSQMGRGEIEKFCRLNAEASEMLRSAMIDMSFSARAHDRIVKVARTIADIEGHADIEVYDIQEALQYRSLDRNFWV